MTTTTHAAAVMLGPNQPLRIEHLPTPDLEPGAALLRTLYSEVCGTDVHLHHGKLDVPFPIIPGHVSVGEIKLGESVAVLGVGPVGQSCVAFASLSGAGDVIAIGAPQPRLDFAKRMGATATFNLDMRSEARLGAVRAMTGGRGTDVVIEA